ncbi:MAG TPA: exodeoxyribonuclease VII small subunit [Gemmataceae bacterium]|jgi:exodeoxyribonuclease VII small subunit
MSESRDDGRTFEESLLELERMVRELEDSRLGLEDALARYEQGVSLIKSCYQQLRRAEQRILLLAGADDEQQPILQPFKHEATAVAKKRP